VALDELPPLLPQALSAATEAAPSRNPRRLTPEFRWSS